MTATSAKRKAEQAKEAEASQSTDVATIDYAADAGAGLEGADRDSFAIPFLGILQTNSPQCDTETGIEGAKAGMLINTVTNDLYGDGVIIVPCAFQRRWVRWGAREAGGGFKGEMTTSVANDLRASGAVKELDNRLYFPEQDGSINPKRSDRLSDVRNHYVLIVAEGGAIGVPAVFALASTGIRVSKNFLSRIESQKITLPDGKLASAPSFAFMYKVTTVKRSNESGTWYQAEINPTGQTLAGVYAQARAFHAQVAAGAVTAAHESNAPEGESGGSQEGF